MLSGKSQSFYPGFILLIFKLGNVIICKVQWNLNETTEIFFQENTFHMLSGFIVLIFKLGSVIACKVQWNLNEYTEIVFKKMHFKSHFKCCLEMSVILFWLQQVNLQVRECDLPVCPGKLYSLISIAHLTQKDKTYYTEHIYVHTEEQLIFA